MSRGMQFVSALCVASLIGNVWLYRQWKPESAEPARGAAVLPQAHRTASETRVVETTAVKATTSPTKTSSKEATEKCKKKMEDEFRRQLRDPQEREKLKRQDIAGLQAINLGAATRLHLNEQTYDRILELQAEQDLSEREASIGTIRSPKGASLNQQIAEEFGDAVAVKWLESQRQSWGRAAMRGVANLFADANVPLSDDQRQRLVGVYADAFEMQSAQDSAPDFQPTQENLRKPHAIQAWWAKLLARQIAFDQQVQTNSASFLTPAQLELLEKHFDVDTERFRATVDSMPTTINDSGESPEPAFEC